MTRLYFELLLLLIYVSYGVFCQKHPEILLEFSDLWDLCLFIPAVFVISFWFLVWNIVPSFNSQE